MIVYLHGFASSGLSRKAGQLRKWLAPLPVLSPSYPQDPQRAVPFLQRYLHQALAAERPQPLLLIGSSLGGYYGQYLAQEYPCGLALINPALDPVRLLRPYLGDNRIYYSGQSFRFEESDLRALEQYAVEDPCAAAGPRLLLLDRGDEVIDTELALSRYRSCARCLVFDDGNHTFTHLHESLQAIRELYRICPRYPAAAGA